MRNFVKKFIFGLSVTCVMLCQFASASNIDSDLDRQKPFFNLPADSFEKTFVQAKGDNAFEKIDSTIQVVVNPVRFLIGFVAVIYLMVAALKLAASRGEDEAVYESFKQSLMYSLIGFAVIALAGEIGNILSLSGGGLIGSKAELSKRLGIFDTNVGIIITFIKYIIGAVAVIFLTRAGAHMVIAGSSEEDISEDKNTILYTSVSLVLLIFSNSLVTKVLYKMDNPFDNPSIDLGQGVAEAVGLINLIVSFVGPLAMLSLVAAGVMYSLSAANEELRERANKMVKLSLFAIILIYGAFAIVSTVISGQIS